MEEVYRIYHCNILDEVVVVKFFQNETGWTLGSMVIEQARKLSAIKELTVTAAMCTIIEEKLGELNG